MSKTAEEGELSSPDEIEASKLAVNELFDFVAGFVCSLSTVVF